jgi:choline-sulfatase
VQIHLYSVFFDTRAERDDAMRRRIVAIGCALLAACAAGAPRLCCTHPRNVLIVTLDTTRADRLPVYGSSGVAMPAVDGLARRGVVFEHAESVAPLTLTAHASIFTGLYPPHHGVRDNLAAPLDRSRATLAEILHARGFETAAFVGSAVLRRDRGLARAFDVYDDGGSGLADVPRRRSAQDVVDSARAWMAHRGNAPFLVWVHLYDAHAPQRLPIGFRRAYGDHYEGALAYMDSQIGRLLDELRAKGELGSTIVLIAGDHGESLGEHGEHEHGIFLYEGALHVPLILRSPGIGARRVGDLCSLVDVLPTVLDLLGIVPAATGDGRSLVPAARGESMPERAIYAESMYAARFGWSPLRMIRDARFKFIDAPRPELYDLAADLFEQHNLAGQRVALAAAMRAGMFASTSDMHPDVAPPVHVRPDVLGQLAALGYVSGTSVRPAPGAAGGLDPKDYIQLYNAIRERSAQ